MTDLSKEVRILQSSMANFNDICTKQRVMVLRALRTIKSAKEDKIPSLIQEEERRLIASMADFEEIRRNERKIALKALYTINFVKDQAIPCVIEQGLFLGSLGAAHNRSELKKLNVTHILTVAHKLGPAYPKDFVYKRIEVPDREDTNLTQHFSECFDFIDEAIMKNSSVLVHCFAGISRSVTIVLAYLMKKRHMSLSQALEHVKRKRPQANPNNGFMLQLKNFEKSLEENEDEKTDENGQAEPNTLEQEDNNNPIMDSAAVSSLSLVDLNHESP